MTDDPTCEPCDLCGQDTRQDGVWPVAGRGGCLECWERETARAYHQVGNRLAERRS